MFEQGFSSKLCSLVISCLVFCGSGHVITTFGKRQNGTTNKQVSMLIWNSFSEYLKTVTNLTSGQGDTYISSCNSNTQFTSITLPW